MKIFLDTANIDEIKEANDWGVICGVTTNPSLIAKEGNIDLKEVIKDITSIVEGPISAEVIGLKWEEMVKEGEELAKINPNIVIKIPMTIDGLKATKILSSKGIKTNVTLIFSASQGLLAARAGATYISPFIGRLDDIGNDGMNVIKDLAEILSIHCISTEIISASIRHPIHVLEAAKSGSDIATIPFKVLKTMVGHPLTDKGIDVFLSDWNSRG